MKKLLLLYAGLATFSVGYSQCVIDSSMQTPGFQPDTGSYLPPACIGSNYEAVIQIYAPETVTISLGTFPVNEVQLDSIPDLPIGFQYATYPINGMINGGEKGCINIYGVVSAVPGDYEFHLWYTANFTAFGGPVSLSFTAPYRIHIDTGTAVSVVVSDTVCQYPGYAFGNTWITASGTYTDTLMNASGCDSIVTLHLTVIPLDLTVTLSGSSLWAVPGFESYQWFDCDANAIIGQETSAVFTPVAPGSYSVMISNGECSGTSPCTTFTEIRTMEHTSPYSVWPQPANDHIQVAGNSRNENFDITIYDLSGKKVWDQTSVSTGASINIGRLSPGSYIVLIATHDNTNYVPLCIIR